MLDLRYGSSMLFFQYRLELLDFRGKGRNVNRCFARNSIQIELPVK